jgi:hypothetical protein
MDNMKTNLKMPLAVPVEMIHIFHVVFADTCISDVLKYDDRGSVSSKQNACWFVNKAIICENKVFPGQKKYRNVKNFIDPNPKNLGRWRIFAVPRSIERTIGPSIDPSWPHLILFCKRFIPELFATNDDVFVKFANFLSVENNQLVNLGLI